MCLKCGTEGEELSGVAVKQAVFHGPASSRALFLATLRVFITYYNGQAGIQYTAGNDLACYSYNHLHQQCGTFARLCDRSRLTCDTTCHKLSLSVLRSGMTRSRL
ncbi:hypothetical protein E2C01_019445 [Portunus trituberculatus]|uniref:Uncharacterized protein n=1 Tax=Portunus trituberculatus TaxID=210409 RepID=A0A5B7DXM3_PORTR|nr:hypothetical protein [Portunus trituberculatus]